MISLLFTVLIFLAVLGIPIAFAIGLSSAVALLLKSDVPLLIVIQKMFTQLDSFPMLAVPFFVLAGGLMDRGGISLKLINFAGNLVGHIRGGLAMVSTVAAMFFAGISGSASADTAAIGSVLIPAMNSKGYSKGYAASVQATAGSIGVIIPPSIPMVIYALTAEVSIGKLFLGGYIPGILLGLGLMLVSYGFAIKHNYPAEPRADLPSLIKSFKESFWALMMAVIIMGGILSGIFTATEASVIAVVYALLVGLFIYKDLKISHLPQILVQSGIITSIVMFCVATTSVLAWILTSEQIPLKLANFMLSITNNPYMILLFINIILLIVGTFLDTTPAIILLVPILLPMVTKLGVDPIHFGLITVTNLAIGMCTPPVGITLFVACSIAEIPMTHLIKSLLPYLAIMITVLMIITYFPGLVMFLPNLFM